MSHLLVDVQLEGQWKEAKSNSGLVGTPLAPYADAFGLQRFRENELIHGRWAMLACLGVVIGEATTGVSWYAHNFPKPHVARLGISL